MHTGEYTHIYLHSNNNDDSQYPRSSISVAPQIQGLSNLVQCAILRRIDEGDKNLMRIGSFNEVYLDFLKPTKWK